MAQRSHVPKFGNWDGEESVPYTAYFDKARKTRTAGGKIINPNDPEDNPDLLSDNEEAPAPAPPSKTIAEREKSLGQGEVKTTNERRSDDMNRRVANESAPQRQGVRGTNSAETYKRPVRPSVGSENSFDRSPLHNQARAAGRVSGDSSPSWEGKAAYKSSHGTPGRSRLKPTSRGDESPDRAAAVPKFGGWDENNPASADGYTHIFNKVREERNTGGRVPGMASPSPYNNIHKPAPTETVKCGCIPWGRK